MVDTLNTVHLWWGLVQLIHLSTKSGALDGNYSSHNVHYRRRSMSSVRRLSTHNMRYESRQRDNVSDPRSSWILLRVLYTLTVFSFFILDGLYMRHENFEHTVRSVTKLRSPRFFGVPAPTTILSNTNAWHPTLALSLKWVSSW